MYLFDTDTITNITKKIPSRKLISNINKLKKEERFLSTITISEITYGAFKSNNPNHYINELKNILLPLVNILPFDSNSAYIYGEIRAELEKRGENLSHCDIQIASIAVANNLILITGNTNHFERISSLRIENWIK
jgi:tRNA(fMet)-specific endonuclease VapC